MLVNTNFGEYAAEKISIVVHGSKLVAFEDL